MPKSFWAQDSEPLVPFAAELVAKAADQMAQMRENALSEGVKKRMDTAIRVISEESEIRLEWVHVDPDVHIDDLGLSHRDGWTVYATSRISPAIMAAIETQKAPPAGADGAS